LGQKGVIIMPNQMPLGSVPALVMGNEDFAFGFRLGRQAYEAEYEGETLTDGDVKRFMEANPGREKHEHGNRVGCELSHLTPVSYSYAIGFVVGCLLLDGAPFASASVFSMAALYDAQCSGDCS
jgi:hypothetical protein